MANILSGGGSSSSSVGDDELFDAVKIIGNIAHDGVDASSPPVKIGGKAASSVPAAVAAGDRVDAYFDPNGRQAIFNQVEDAAHASGDPGVFVLGVRNDALATTLTSADLDYSPIATTSKGAVHTQESLIPGSEVNTGTLPYMRTRERCAFINITADTNVLAGSGFYYGFFCNSISGGSITSIYDNTAASGTKIHSTFTPVAGTAYYPPKAVRCGTGLYFDVAATIDITVFYDPD